MSDLLYQTIDRICQCTEILYELLNPAMEQSVQLLKEGPSENRSVVTRKKEVVHQIEATVKSRLERILQSDLPAVNIHYGGMNQELLREEGAIAAAVNKDIYIREEAYLEGSAETDAILLHEMTHILQMEQGKRLNSLEEIAEAEQEAYQAESLAYPEHKKYYYAQIGGELFRMNKQSEKQAIEYAAKLLKEMINKVIAEENIELLAKIQQALEKKI